MQKTDTEYLRFLWPMRHFLVTCGDSGRSNIIAVSFCMPVSRTPPMVGCAIGPSMYSAELIGDTGEFVVNVPPGNLDPQVYLCGTCSGRDVDKFEKTGFTPVPGRSVDVPVIGECVAHIECRVTAGLETGSKILFVGEVVEAYADPDVADGSRTVQFTFSEFPEAVYSTRFAKE
jgi:flavin reductase (DIM6/NTAB) family NADH-FMN oxidoreductase RutF